MEEKMEKRIKAVCKYSRYTDGEYTVYVDLDSTHYYKDGFSHRENDLPAIIWKDGGLTWCKDGLPHREGGKPAMVFADGRELFFVDGEFIDK